jgi:hypothetical protein
LSCHVDDRFDAALRFLLFDDATTAELQLLAKVDVLAEILSKSAKWIRHQVSRVTNESSEAHSRAPG